MPRLIAVALVAALGLGAWAVVALASGPPPPLPEPTDKVDPEIADGTAQRELDDARERWRVAAVDSYRMRVRRVCFCGRRATRRAWVLVRDGKPVDPPARVRAVATVERLQGQVQRAIDESYDGLSVRYGARGVPRRIALDPFDWLFDEEDRYVVDRVRAR
jgi:hypothetical protein